MKKLSRIVWNMMSDQWMDLPKLDVFYCHSELWGLQTFSTASNIASDLLFWYKSFKYLTYTTLILPQNKCIWAILQMSFFWFGESISFFSLLWHQKLLTAMKMMFFSVVRQVHLNSKEKPCSVYLSLLGYGALM